MNGKCPLSLLILTYNEEKNIEHCLKSTHDWVSETIIIDSYSTDKTLEICKKYTDKIYQHPFENQAKQFNWALDNVPIADDWIIRLDADEMVTPELAREICETLPKLSKKVTGIYMKRRVYFLGRWIKHGGYYPTWFLRTFRKGKGRYEEITEEHIVLSDGETIKLKNDFIDYNRKGLTFWTDKHNHWAIGKMKDTLCMMGNGELPEGTIEQSLFGTQEKHKRWLEVNVYARCPMFLRAFLYFCYRYFFLLGFLDGKEGLTFHFLQGFWYRFYVDAKIYEAKKFGISEAERAIEYTGSKPWT
ncbi:MAG: glycosyltransferase family 2 protein [Candidatus Brocadiales bacterium]